MKILLLEHPRRIAAERCNDIANAPLCSCLLSGYIAAVLQKDGHDVEIIEGYLERLAYDEVLARVSSMRPDILGVHMVYTWERDRAFSGFLERVKAELSACIAAFGFYPTVAYRDILENCRAIDGIIAGEPEGAMSRLASSACPQEEASAVPGFITRDGAGGFRVNKAETIEDLDAIPFPVRTDALLRLPEVNILGSRGCYGRCVFCSVNAFFGRGASWRGRRPENIMEEIDSLLGQTGSKDFYFTDANFFGPGAPGQERALRIAALVKERKIRFGIEGRVNDIHDETIGALADAGLRHILIGIESGRDASLKRLNKMTTAAQNEEAIRTLRKHGIEPNVGFIMFEPDATLSDVRCNLEFLKRNDLLKNLSVTANVLYHHQIVLEGTEGYSRLKEKGRLVVPESSSYEGTACFENRRVAALAAIMRRITNKLFSSLDDVWSGRTAEPACAEGFYASLNHLLTAVFEEHLTALEAGETLSEEEISAIVRGAEKKIENTVEAFRLPIREGPRQNEPKGAASEETAN